MNKQSFIFHNLNRYDPITIKKIFKFECNQPLSLKTKSILNNWAHLKTGKRFYNLIDDILYFIKYNSHDYHLMSQIFNTISNYLQNNTYVNFFDILISDIQIKKYKYENRFFHAQDMKYTEFLLITVVCVIKQIPKKTEIPWE